MIPEVFDVKVDEFADEQLDAADRLGGELIRFVRLIHGIGSHIAAEQSDGMERPAYALLAHLVVDGPLRTTALAEAVHSDPSTVSRQTTSLVRAGLVERTSDPSDGRACLLVATGKGREVFEHNRKRRSAHIAGVTSGWSPEDVARFVGFLERFNSDLDSYRTRIIGTETPRAPGTPGSAEDSESRVPHAGSATARHEGAMAQ